MFCSLIRKPAAWSADLAMTQTQRDPKDPQRQTKGDIHDRYLSRMDAVIRNLPSAGARCSAVTLRSPSVFANQVTRSTSHVTRHPCARIGSPHLSGGGPSRKIQFGFSGPPASKQTIRTHQRFPRKLSRKPLRVVPHRRGPAGSS